MTGRPSIFDQGVFDEILERHTEGQTIRSILLGTPGEHPEFPGNVGKRFPSRSTLYSWLEGAEELSGHMARARAIAEDTLADEVIDVARTPEDGYEDKLMFKELDDGEGGKTNELEVVERKRKDMLGHRRFKTERILDILARWNPAKWGARMNVGHSLTDPLTERLNAAHERERTLRDE